MRACLLLRFQWRTSEWHSPKWKWRTFQRGYSREKEKDLVVGRGDKRRKELPAQHKLGACVWIRNRRTAVTKHVLRPLAKSQFIEYMNINPVRYKNGLSDPRMFKILAFVSLGFILHHMNSPGFGHSHPSPKPHILKAWLPVFGVLSCGTREKVT